MKLAFKVISFLIIGFIVIIAADGYISIQREIDLFDSNMKNKAKLLGHALKELISDVWHTSGQERAISLLNDVNKGEHQIFIRWVWLDAKPRKVFFPSVDPARLTIVRDGHELIQIGEKGYMYSYVPVNIPGNRVGALELSESLDEKQLYTSLTIKKTTLLICLTVVVCGLLAYLLGITKIGRPLKLLKMKARRIGEGDLSCKINIKGYDELSELDAILDSMCKKLLLAREKTEQEIEARMKAVEQLHHANRLKTLGSLSSGIAHELGTPLNVVLGRAGMISSGNQSREETVNCAHIIKNQAERMTSMISQFLDFARYSTSSKRTVDLFNISKQAIDLFRPVANNKNISLLLIAKNNPLPITVDQEKIKQVLINLITNALHATSIGGKIEVHIFSKYISEKMDEKKTKGNYVCMMVKDEGEGISDEILPHIFEPFFTTKESGEGTGLGLSIVQSIIQDHNGWITIDSQHKKGSCFTIYIPRADDI